VKDSVGYSIGGCKRSDVLKLLHSKLPPDVVSFNRSFYSLERDKNGILKVETEDGEILEADIVVGADG
jgi:2-polyprenyl-6-methoxyphenol hydroxylase-like FAD-dependent oxidoreductase